MGNTVIFCTDSFALIVKRPVCILSFPPNQKSKKTCERRTALIQSLPSDILDRSTKAECGICFEVVMDKNRRFGLMPGCDHPFCLECILAWRAKGKDMDNPSELAKSCPTCRRESLFVIPSVIFCTGQLKDKMSEQYKGSLRSTRCKYFSNKGNCPFGKDCFYAHINPDGTTADSSKMQNVVTTNRSKKGYYRDASSVLFVDLAEGMDLIDTLSRLAHMQPERVMEILMELMLDESGYESDDL